MTINFIEFRFFAPKRHLMSTIFENVKTDRQFSATTGFTKVEFYDLVFEYDLTEAQFLEGGNLPPNFPATLQKVEERVFFTLYFLKVYPTLDVLGICFGMDATTASKFLGRSLFILEKSLQRVKMLPTRQFLDHKELQRVLADHKELFIDATERRTQRPENEADQEDAYSGKKKPTR